MTDLNEQLNYRLLESALLKRKASDQIQLDDKVLSAAINREKALTKAQAKLLINSPLTILRFRHLFNAQKKQRSSSGWSGSEGLLLAAASDQEISSLSTTDHLWSLHFLATQPGLFDVILKCQAGDDILDQLLEAEQVIEVIDNKGHKICQGELDEDGELEARWPFTLSPRHYFQEIGEGFKVRPLKAD